MLFEMVKKIKTYAKESAWVVGGQVISLIGSLVLVKLLTTELNPEQFGLLALSLTAVGLINQLAMNSFGASIGRFYPVALAQNNLPQYTKAALNILFYAGISSIAIGLAIPIILVNLNHSDWGWLIFLGFLFATLSLFNFSANNIQNAARNRKNVAINTLLEVWLKIFFSFFIIKILGANPYAVLIGYCIAISIVLCFQAFSLNKLLFSKIKLSNFDKCGQTLSTETKIRQTFFWKQNIWQYAWPFAAWGSFTWAQQVSDLWSLKIFTSIHDVGLYSVAFQLGFAPIVLLNSVIQLFLGPILNQWVGLDKQANTLNYVHNVTWYTTFASLIFTLLAFIFFSSFHEWLFSWLVASEFRSASIYLAWMALAGGLFSAGQILSLKLMSLFNTRNMLNVKICTSLLGLLLNIFGAWYFGVHGIIASVVIFSFVYFIWMAWLTWQKQH